MSEISFEETLEWAQKYNTKKSKNGSMKILYIVGGVIVILFIIWCLIIIYSGKNDDLSNENIIDDMNDPNLSTPAV